MAQVTVDTRKFSRKVNSASRAIRKAQRRAKRDAAKQTKTAMSKDVRQVINLPVKRINDKISIRRKRNGDRQEVRTAYTPVPAHQFRGWAYTHGTRSGGIARETARRSTLAKTGKIGLKVRFYKGKPPIVFPKAFRQAKVGAGKVFIQRAGKPRYPLTAITGPPPWNVVDENFAEYVDNGEAVYRRRLRYWRRRELKRAKA